VEIGYVKNN